MHVKALDRGAGQLCILAQDCDNDEITKLVKALCQESGTRASSWPTRAKELAEWCGLCKLNEDGTVKKAVKCAVVVVTDYGAGDCCQGRRREVCGVNAVKLYIDKIILDF